MDAPLIFLWAGFGPAKTVQLARAVLVRCGGDQSCQCPALLPWEKAILPGPVLALFPRWSWQEPTRDVHRPLSAITRVPGFSLLPGSCLRWVSKIP